ncbi:hypothetical protein QTG54_003432, partial [Skeletonema marinoi]
QQKQQQSAPSSPQSTSVKVHPASKTKATTKSTSNKVEPSKGGINKTEDTSKKQNITKKQWGRVSRPARESTTTTKIERKSSCSTTSDDSSDDEAGPQHDRTKSRRETSSNIEHKSSRSKHNNKQKKSQSSSDKPRKDSRKDSSSKKTSTKAKEKSHAISQKAKKPSGTVKSKKTSSQGSNLTDSKSSSPKKVSKTDCTKKQRCKSENANHKLSASCPSLFDDDDKKGRSISLERKSSVDGKTHANNTPSRAVPSSSHTPPKPTKTTLTPPAAPKASAPSSFATFQPAVETLTKQYRCPLTKEVMKEPMSDFEGNNYEKDAILKYLETHSTSPVSGNPLFPLHLTSNSALKERIKYTLKLKNCLDALTSQEKSASTCGLVIKESSVQMSQQCHFKPLSLRQSVDMFIKELNSVSPNGIINRLDSSGKASFTYKGLDFTLQVPEGLSHNIILQTWFDQDKKAAGISARIVEWNRSLQEIGIGGQLTFRNIKGKFAFTLTREMKPEKFCKKDLKHAMEYYLEMSIKLHNTINVTDQKKVDKVRLQDSSFAQ